MPLVHSRGSRGRASRLLSTIRLRSAREPQAFWLPERRQTCDASSRRLFPHPRVLFPARLLPRGGLPVHLLGSPARRPLSCGGLLTLAFVLGEERRDLAQRGRARSRTAAAGV